MDTAAQRSGPPCAPFDSPEAYLFDIWLRQLDETPAKHVRSLGCPKRESIAFFFARLSSYTFYRNENAGIIVEN
jgi:hypothetical protein